jgi:ribosome-binding protein aMBF1 (putative translation factor)
MAGSLQRKELIAHTSMYVNTTLKQVAPYVAPVAKRNPTSGERAVLYDLLAELRKRVGKTQKQVADALGVDQGFVSRYERGERLLDLVQLWELSRVLGISLVDLVSEFEQRLGKAKGDALEGRILRE